MHDQIHGNLAVKEESRRLFLLVCLWFCLISLLLSCATLSALHASPPIPHHSTIHRDTQSSTILRPTRLVHSSSTMHRPTNDSGSKGLTKKQLLLIALGGAVGLFALTTTTTPLFSTPSAPSAGRSLRRRQLSHAGVSLRIACP